LGGVTVPHTHGLAGHSDGDVLTHAIMDAVLGAANLGDKGAHFPSSDARYKGISSLVLLDRTVGMARDAGWKVGNVDATIIAQRPTLAAFIPRMRSHLATVLSVPVDCVSVKATTTDHLGFIGRGEGIAALAVALLEATG
jgi:2-C-methyl-D-erythritol 2,4-cyclodiphosphate synthase